MRKNLASLRSDEGFSKSVSSIMMRSIVARMIGLVLLCCVGCSSVGDQLQKIVGTKAPESRLMFLDGSEVPLSAYQGKSVAILFWATWCKFSRSTIERYEGLARTYSQVRDLEFIAVSIDKNEDFKTLKDRIKEQDLRTLTHIFSGNDSLDDAFVNLNGKKIPYVVLIDANGVVRLVDTELGNLENFLAGRY